MHRITLLALTAFFGLTLLTPPSAVAAGNYRTPDGTAFVLLAPGSQTMMNGSSEDLRRAKALRVDDERLLYVRQGGAAYVIRDAAILRRAGSILKPQEALGARQAELGSRQAALGQRQAALGTEQARLGGRQADASPRQQAELSRQQTELSRRQTELSRQQSDLGNQQSALGSEQGRLAREAEAKFRALLADALQHGAAQRVD
jgi:hypothetical protein